MFYNRYKARRYYHENINKRTLCIAPDAGLATNCCGDPIRLKDVAKRQEISEKYLEQIISVLNKAGFVRSIRGPQAVMS